MNYQNPNPYGYRNKTKKTYLHKVSKQLVVVLVLMLVLMLLKYTNTNSTKLISGKLKTMINSDYTTETTQAIKTYSPEVINVVGNFIDKYKGTDEPEEETLPVNASN